MKVEMQASLHAVAGVCMPSDGGSSGRRTNGRFRKQRFHTVETHARYTIIWGHIFHLSFNTYETKKFKNNSKDSDCLVGRRRRFTEFMGKRLPKFEGTLVADWTYLDSKRYEFNDRESKVAFMFSTTNWVEIFPMEFDEHKRFAKY